MSKKLHRVLAIEDDENAFHLLKLALRHLPIEVINAPSVAEAIAFIEREVPALIFLDINLPDAYGWEVLDAFKETRRIKHTPVIVLTAHKEPVNRIIGSLQAVAVYLNKPFKREELLKRVSTLLNLND
ncbi:MAG: response regulator [Anaerolineales bacterium]|nr:response regulator [Anaerolineales bacterium]